MSNIDTEIRQDQVAGLILAGGRGRRMGSRDKALVDFEGASLIERVFTSLSPQVDQIFISRQADQQDLSKYGKVLTDEYADAGPLEGCRVAITSVKNMDFRYLVVVPVDCPKIPSDLVNRLIQNKNIHAVVRTEIGLEPTFVLFDLKYLEKAWEVMEIANGALKNVVSQPEFSRVMFTSKEIKNINSL